MVGIITSPPFLAMPGDIGIPIYFYLRIFIIGFFIAHIWSLSAMNRLRESKWFLGIANPLSIICILLMLSAGAKEHLEYYSRFVALPVKYLGWEYPTSFALICGILLAITITPGTWTHHVFAWTGLRVVGIMSFSLYLVHFRIFIIIKEKYGHDGFLLFMETFTLSLVVALLLERFIERPSMKIGRLINARIPVCLSSNLPSASKHQRMGRTQ